MKQKQQQQQIITVQDQLTEIHAILDMARFGDRMVVIRQNGALPPQTSTVMGLVLAEPRLSSAVGVDLFDGEPHMVRTHSGSIPGTIHSLDLIRDRVMIAVYRRSQAGQSSQSSQASQASPLEQP